MITGRCLRGAVRLEIDGTPAPPRACHCEQCRRRSGRHRAATRVPAADLRVTGEVRWYAASEKARLGFCPACGSLPLWDAQDRGTVSVAVGALDPPTGLRIEEHIRVSAKGDYYQIADGAPQHER